MGAATSTETSRRVLAAWTPQAGPQAEACVATWCEELFFGGARGGGKTDQLLGDYLQDVQKYGRHWQGVLFRKSYPDLQEVIERAQALFAPTGAVWKEQKRQFHWPNGACLRIRYLAKDTDAQHYQGHQYTWIGWEELPQFASPAPYHKLKACLRWTKAKVPTKRIRSNGNPGGAGHQWVKEYFITHAPKGFVPRTDEATGHRIMFIPSRITDNRILLDADPGYIGRLRGVGSEALVRAWLEGDWNAVAGAYFGEFGDAHILAPRKIPEHFVRFRAFDWGSARPFSVGWWAVSDGSDGVPRGALIRYREWYGRKGPNEGLGLYADAVADGILQREGSETQRITYSVCDPSCFKQDGGPSIAEIFHRKGIYFRPADNSRIAGWTQLRNRLSGVDDRPLIYTFATCTDSIRTIPTLQHDERHPEDIDSEGEDHAADEWRYACMSRPWSQDAPAIPAPITKKPTLNDILSANGLL